MRPRACEVAVASLAIALGIASVDVTYDGKLDGNIGIAGVGEVDAIDAIVESVRGPDEGPSISGAARWQEIDDYLGIKNRPKSSGRKGNRENNGPLKEEYGGTGNAEQDFDTLTGGEWVEDSKGYRWGPHRELFRPGSSKKGPRIDLPATGGKRAEGMHYPVVDDPEVNDTSIEDEEGESNG